jgi:pilus assembly protein CpaF
MHFEIKQDLESLLQRLPTEMNIDLADAAARLHREPSIKQRVNTLLEGHANKDRLFEELFGLGPLKPLLEDPSVTEILINGADSIWFERDGHFQVHPDCFLSAFTLSQFVQMIGTEARLRLDLSQPFADGSWRGFRVHLAQGPLIDRTHSICIRRHPEYSWRLDDFLQNGWASDLQIQNLRSLLSSRANFLVVGPTGSGKTSVLSALLCELPQNERVVIIEDTCEIKLANQISIKLFTRSDAQGVLQDFDQAALVKQSLRMRPARLVIGEVRGAEAKDLLLALSTGHSGSLGSLHAVSARQALLRLEMLVQMGAPDWSLDTIRNLIFTSLNAVVVVGMIEGKRFLEGIYKICSLEKFGFLIEKL